MPDKTAQYLSDFFHLFFPHTCEGCGTDIIDNSSLLCAACIVQLPVTGFISEAGNPVERKFYGQLKIESAGSAFYFTKNSLLQHLVKQLKYHSNKDIGYYLGELLGHHLSQTERFNGVDAIIPLPLNWRKEKKRGYNQAAVIAEGIASVWPKPLLLASLRRNVFTETQTHKDRVSRWQTMQGVFAVSDTSSIEDRHILLVDDIITTGATLEACGECILELPGTKLSIATIAFTI